MASWVDPAATVQQGREQPGSLEYGGWLPGFGNAELEAQYLVWRSQHLIKYERLVHTLVTPLWLACSALRPLPLLSAAAAAPGVAAMGHTAFSPGVGLVLVAAWSLLHCYCLWKQVTWYSQRRETICLAAWAVHFWYFWNYTRPAMLLRRPAPLPPSLSSAASAAPGVAAAAKQAATAVASSFSSTLGAAGARAAAEVGAGSATGAAAAVLGARPPPPRLNWAVGAEPNILVPLCNIIRVRMHIPLMLLLAAVSWHHSHKFCSSAVATAAAGIGGGIGGDSTVTAVAVAECQARAMKFVAASSLFPLLVTYFLEFSSRRCFLIAVAAHQRWAAATRNNGGSRDT